MYIMKIVINNIIPLKGLEDVKKNMLPFEKLPKVNSERWLNVKNLDGEVWIDVPSFEGLYKISCYGRILSLPRQVKRGRGQYVRNKKILRLKHHKKFLYYRITLYTAEGKPFDISIHRLLAISFLGYQHNKVVNHIDENKLNPILTNLEWCTQRENCNYGNAINRMKDSLRKNGHFKPVALISDCGHILKTYDSITDAARDLHLTPTGVMRSCKNERKYDGLNFRYLNDL